MNKLTTLFLSCILFTLAIQSCDNSKTYAEQLEDEKKAINRFIDKNRIKVISYEEFEKNKFETDTAENEYVRLSDGVYLQILDKGLAESDSIRDGDVVTVRFLEYDIMAEDTTWASNWDQPSVLDVFDYRKTGSQVYGSFKFGSIYSNYQTAAVPEGWLVPLEYVRSGDAKIKIIVPSKQGHQTAQSNVTPFFYDLKHIKVY